MKRATVYVLYLTKGTTFRMYLSAGVRLLATMVVKRPPAKGGRLAANWAVWNGLRQAGNADSDRYLQHAGTLLLARDSTTVPSWLHRPCVLY